MALTTLGWQWPVLVTAMPQVQSRYFLPSVPHTHVPCACGCVRPAQARLAYAVDDDVRGAGRPDVRKLPHVRLQLRIGDGTARDRRAMDRGAGAGARTRRTGEHGSFSSDRFHGQVAVTAVLCARKAAPAPWSAASRDDDAHSSPEHHLGCAPVVLRRRSAMKRTRVPDLFLGAIGTILTFTIFGDIRTYPIKLIMFLCACIAAGYGISPHPLASSHPRPPTVTRSSSLPIVLSSSNHGSVGQYQC